MTEAEAYFIAVGQAVIVLRERKGLSQKELATSLGITQSMLSRIERGDTALDAYYLVRLEQALGLSPQLLDRTAREAFRLAQQVAEHTTGWSWEEVLARVGQPGIAGLAAFVVLLVLSGPP